LRGAAATLTGCETPQDNTVECLYIYTYTHNHPYKEAGDSREEAQRHLNGHFLC